MASDSAARLTDAADHFPYKRDAALDALEAPAEGGNHPGSWYTSEEIVEASAAYVEAQQAYLENPDDETRETYRTAADDLVLARQFHRADRQGLQVRGANQEG